jgi:hypothetical protein
LAARDARWHVWSPTLKHRDTIDLIGGLLMTALGLFAALYARQYDFGTPARMGPGFFPQVLGWLLAVLGVLIAIPAWFRAGPKADVRWKNTLFVIASILVFGFTLKWAGLVLSTFAAAFVSTLAAEDITWRGRFIVSAGVSVVTALIFVVGLGMILPLWPFSH